MTAIHAIFVGRPQTRQDGQGTWRSSVYRTLVDGPVALGVSGLEGDEVTDTRHHGKPNQAVCCHPLDHYRFQTS